MAVRAYLGTTGTIFGLIVLAHLLRVTHGEAALLSDPWWVLLTLAAVGLCIWAWILFARTRRP